MPFQDPPTKRLQLVFLEHVLLQSVRFSVGVQDPSLVWCGVSRNVPTLFDFLLIALGMRQKCFGLEMAIPALLFLACLDIEFTRVHLHVLRTHLQLCRHLLRSALTHFKQPMVSSPSSEGKTRKCSCEEKIAPRRVVDAWGSNH